LVKRLIMMTIAPSVELSTVIAISITATWGKKYGRR